MSSRRIGLITLVLLGSGVPAQGIRWAASVDDALAEAKAQNKVVMLALNQDGEKASDAMMREHYRDSAVVELSGHTINVFCSNDEHGKSGKCPRCGSGSCTGHRNNDFNARKKFFEVDAATKVVAPQHVFVSPDGKVICSVAERITAGELEWMLVHAIGTVNPQFKWTESGRFRAPARFKKADVDKSKNGLDPMPSKRDVTDALKELKKSSSNGGRGGGRGGRFGGRFGLNNADDKWVDIVLRSDSSAAVGYGKSKLKDSRFGRSRLIRKIGTLSPEAWFKVVVPWLSAEEQRTRRAAIVALERLHSDKALGNLKTAYRKEKEDELAGRILRAMAELGPVNGPVIAAVKKAVHAHKSEVVRAHATVAAGILEDRDAVTECLRKALQDTSVIVRSTAAYVIAIRQDKSLLDALVGVMKVESIAETKDWMEKAKKAVQAADPAPFEKFLEQTLDKSERSPFGEGGRGRGRGGEGGAGEGGSGEGGSGRGRRRRG